MMHLENIKKVLVVCTGNICRSPMAEGVLRYKFDQAGFNIHLHSAGTSGWDKHKPTSEAVQACLEIGIDISSLRSDPISKQMILDSDIILAMEHYHINEMVKSYHATVEKLFLLGDFHVDKPGLEIEDPYGMPISYYRKILNIICQCSDGLIKKIKNNKSA